MKTAAGTNGEPRAVHTQPFPIDQNVYVPAVNGVSTTWLRS